MKTPWKLAVTIIFVSVFMACSNHPKVVQGTVLSYDDNAKTMVVVNEVQPNSQMTFSLKGAEIGAKPMPNDVVRIVYKDEGGSLIATRVMNLTRQKEVGKGGRK